MGSVIGTRWARIQAEDEVPKVMNHSSEFSKLSLKAGETIMLRLEMLVGWADDAMGPPPEGKYQGLADIKLGPEWLVSPPFDFEVTPPIGQPPAAASERGEPMIRRNPLRGFTAIELVVVTAIIAVLVTATVIYVRRAQHAKWQALADSQPTKVFAVRAYPIKDVFEDGDPVVVMCEVTNTAPYAVRFRWTDLIAWPKSKTAVPDLYSSKMMTVHTPWEELAGDDVVDSWEKHQKQRHYARLMAPRETARYRLELRMDRDTESWVRAGMPTSALIGPPPPDDYEAVVTFAEIPKDDDGNLIFLSGLKREQLESTPIRFHRYSEEINPCRGSRRTNRDQKMIARRGFTAVELVLVTAIMAVVITATLIYVRRAQQAKWQALADAEPAKVFEVTATMDKVVYKNRANIEMTVQIVNTAPCSIEFFSGPIGIHNFTTSTTIVPKLTVLSPAPSRGPITATRIQTLKSGESARFHLVYSERGFKGAETRRLMVQTKHNYGMFRINDPLMLWSDPLNYTVSPVDAQQAKWQAMVASEPEKYLSVKAAPVKATFAKGEDVIVISEITNNASFNYEMIGVINVYPYSPSTITSIGMRWGRIGSADELPEFVHETWEINGELINAGETMILRHELLVGTADAALGSPPVGDYRGVVVLHLGGPQPFRSSDFAFVVEAAEPTSSPAATETGDEGAP